VCCICRHLEDVDGTMTNITGEFRIMGQELNDQFDAFKKELRQMSEAQKLFSRMAARSGAAGATAEGGRGSAIVAEDQISALSLQSESEKDSEGFDSETGSRMDLKQSVGKDDFVFKKTHSRQKRHVSRPIDSNMYKFLYTLGRWICEWCYP